MLSQADKPVEYRDLFKQPLERNLLEQLAELAPGGVKDLLSTRGRKYRELGLKDRDLADGELLDLMVEEPGLLRRPLVTDGEQLVIGYKEDALRALAGL